MAIYFYIKFLFITNTTDLSKLYFAQPLLHVDIQFLQTVYLTQIQVFFLDIVLSELWRTQPTVHSLEKHFCHQVNYFYILITILNEINILKKKYINLIWNFKKAGVLRKWRGLHPNFNLIKTLFQFYFILKCTDGF